MFFAFGRPREDQSPILRSKGVSSKVLISEVGPRDGLQNCKAIMPTAEKERWIRALYDAGIEEIEVGSFVSPKLLPQMADTGEIVRFAKTLPGLTVAVLVPNMKGAQLAIEAGADKLTIPLSVSETHSIKNIRRTHDQVIEEALNIAALVAEQPEDARPHLEGSLSTAFGCTIEGAIPEAVILKLATRLMGAGCDEVGLSDTTGYADPASIRQLIRSVRAEVGAENLTGVHLHNTRGLGLANALAAYEEGITTFDASQAGLGGCPTSPGASGNIVTEDIVFMFESMGISTGVDLEALMACREILAASLPDEELYGFTPRAGLPLGFKQEAVAAIS
ncbi:MAG TPA: hydroxymethylglutaryl-CoA lyase [Hyphomonadaceae bacterium]|nr:hydroxymethylglutaryl-CoA lyase [Ponticaulis sp.]RPG18942.1 MAG: hydroxymethylglutaryl-CoA lyase [Hyphomonadaceae bacterium TMED125]HBH89412.1 hydroxymethylglutaryl-CoA lyase [Hyphomonadaceae bacterium]HBJ93706.1 hydroxymethylglutaryl-CoA lyase [Hyphomonadaceae bacterium]